MRYFIKRFRCGVLYCRVKTETKTGVCVGGDGASNDEWIDQELSESRFCDERLSKRLLTLVKQLAGGDAASIPMACQDWANTKATYRFYQTNALTSRTFCRVISNRQGPDLSRPTKEFWCYMIRLKSRISGRILASYISPNTAWINGGAMSTRYAVFQCTRVWW